MVRCSSKMYKQAGIDEVRKVGTYRKDLIILDFQSLHTPVMAVRIKDLARWKRGSTLRFMHKENTRQSVPSLVKGYSLQRKRL